MSALEQEIQTYNHHLPELISQAGRFVLIHGEEVCGTFDSYGDALTTGYEKFGLSPFLVKRISAADQIAFFTRDFGACPVSMSA